MNATKRRHLVTAATMTVLTLVLVMMAVIGAKFLTEPFGNETKSASGPDCPPEEQVVKRTLRRGEVQVSVYNAGGKTGAARDLLNRLESAGFQPGEVGNAPEGVTVDTTTVMTDSDDDAGAQLVALVLGKDVPVQHDNEEYGPGVDVFIGGTVGKLQRKAPRTIELAEPRITCMGG